MLLCAAMLFGVASCDRNEDDGDLSSEEWVDMGLPSGLLWASCNIGANSPEEFGNYYAWGETQTKEMYDESTYSYYTFDADDGFLLTKYNTKEPYGTVDNKTVLEASDDVATAVLGNGARIPTFDDWEELLDNTTGEETEHNGVYGWKFTATNGNSIFLPAAGVRVYSSLHLAGGEGRYWSSSLLTDSPDCAWFFNFDQDYPDNSGMVGNDRIDGQSVRAVRASKN